MDRLSVVVATLCCLAACDNGTHTTENSPGRVETVLARSNKTWSELCDVVPSRPSVVRWPELSSGSVAPQAGTSFRWVNVWASWCKPCVEELPLLTQTIRLWQDKGQRVALTLISVDAEAESADAFLSARPELPKTVRLKDSSAAPSWLTELGFGAGTSIPVHIILDAQDKLLCARAGSISTRELDQFQKLMFP
jgi:thiol-disulfide isomerase/thioredoxin